MAYDEICINNLWRAAKVFFCIFNYQPLGSKTGLYIIFFFQFKCTDLQSEFIDLLTNFSGFFFPLQFDW